MSVTKEEIISWIKSVKQLSKARNKADMTMLMDIRPIEVFENRFLKLGQIDLKELEEGFLNLYEKFCTRIIAGSDYEAGSGRMVDSISSFAKLIYLMDLGYGIYVGVLFDRRDLVQPHFEHKKEIEQAFDILFKKRFYLHQYLDPFADLKIKVESEISRIGSGLNFLNDSGLLTSTMIDEYEIAVKNMRQSNQISLSSIRELVVELLEKEGKAFSLDESDPKIRQENFFEKVNKIIPGFNLTNFNREFDSDKSQIKLMAEIFDKPMECVVNYGDGLDKIADLLNPLIEKNTGKSLLCIDKLTGSYKFVLVPVEKKNLLKKNPLVYN